MRIYIPDSHWFYSNTPCTDIKRHYTQRRVRDDPYNPVSCSGEKSSVDVFLMKFYVVDNRVSHIGEYLSGILIIIDVSPRQECNEKKDTVIQVNNIYLTVINVTRYIELKI